MTDQGDTGDRDTGSISSPPRPRRPSALPRPGARKRKLGSLVPPADESTPRAAPAAPPERKTVPELAGDDDETIITGHDIVIDGFDFRLRFAAISRRGRKRIDRGRHAPNEDALRCEVERGLFAVADGMGGHAAGEVASRLCLDTIEAVISGPAATSIIEGLVTGPGVEQRELLEDLARRAAQAAHDRVRREAAADPDNKGMGTTLDFVLLARDQGFFAHVGDSRAYVVRPTVTLQLTDDHAAYDTLRTSGKRMSNRSMARSPLANSIGHGDRVRVDTLHVDLAEGDRIILCTDGAFEAFEGAGEMMKACRYGDEPLELCRHFVDTAVEREITDDISVVSIFLDERSTDRRADTSLRTQDLGTLRGSPLLAGLPVGSVLATLAAGVEVSLAEGTRVPAAIAGDRVAYVILDGVVAMPDGRFLGPSGLLLVESLLDIATRGDMPLVTEKARLYRIGRGDFEQVCDHNVALAAALFRRIARFLAS